jgi:hypothetical protein
MDFRRIPSFELQGEMEQMQRMQTFTWHLHGGYHRHVGYTQGVSKCRATLHSKESADFSMEIFRQHISFHAPNELEELSRQIENAGRASNQFCFD